MQVPVSLLASASITAVRQVCGPASPTTCVPGACPFLEPKSQGFWIHRLDLATLTAAEICGAVQCLQANSPLLSRLLPLWSEPGEDCAAFDLGPCAADADGLPSPSGSRDAIAALCGFQDNALATTLRRTVAILPNTGLCTTMGTGIQVGGVALGHRWISVGSPLRILRTWGSRRHASPWGEVVAEAHRAGHVRRRSRRAERAHPGRGGAGRGGYDPPARTIPVG